ncbi:MAG: hypothetical protein IPP17_22275 [Bacteroidetes bacterium]|nr:hypothetical protein [Bacteroidota bacterium]
MCFFFYNDDSEPGLKGQSEDGVKIGARQLNAGWRFRNGQKCSGMDGRSVHPSTAGKLNSSNQPSNKRIK